MKILGVVALAIVFVACSGCAMITGTITGPFTGAVDLPVQTYFHNAPAFHENPMLYGLDALIVGPCGIVVGPVTGLIKGASLDVEWVCGKVSYGEVFGTCHEASIWRPCTIEWPSKGMMAKSMAKPMQ